MARKFAVFFTPRLKASHQAVMAHFGRAARVAGDKCQVEELETEANALALGERAMVIDPLSDFYNFTRKLVTVARERGERGSCRASQSHAPASFLQ